MKVNGEKIRQLRWARRWSIRILGAHAGITRTQMTNIELRSQSTTPRTAKKIARALEVKLKEIT